MTALFFWLRWNFTLILAPEFLLINFETQLVANIKYRRFHITSPRSVCEVGKLGTKLRRSQYRINLRTSKRSCQLWRHWTSKLIFILSLSETRGWGGGGGGGMRTPCTLSLDPPLHILTLWREERFFRKWAWVQMIRCTHLCMFNCYKTIGLRRSWKYCFKRINILHDCRCRLGKYTTIVHMVFSYVRIQLSL